MLAGAEPPIIERMWRCSPVPPRRGRTHRSRLRSSWGRVLWAGGALAMTVTLSATASVSAAPMRGVGEAKGSEWKQPPRASVVRSRALRRARTEAIVHALEGLAGVDKAARRAILSSHGEWTGAYRIVEEVRDGDAVRLTIEVDVDLARLTKRVAKTAAVADARRPRFTLGEVKAGADSACGDPQTLHTVVSAELAALGAVSEAAGKGTVPVVVSVSCDRLGPVRYTHMQAARVVVVARTAEHTVASATRDAFADAADAAVDSGLSAALFAVGARLSAHQRGRLTVKVNAPGAGRRVRRLERAIRDDVLGVSDVRVSGLTPGAVVLTLDTNLAAAVLAKRLAALRLPDFSVIIVGTEEPDAVTIRLN